MSQCSLAKLPTWSISSSGVSRRFEGTISHMADGKFSNLSTGFIVDRNPAWISAESDCVELGRTLHTSGEPSTAILLHLNGFCVQDYETRAQILVEGKQLTWRFASEVVSHSRGGIHLIGDDYTRRDPLEYAFLRFIWLCQHEVESLGRVNSRSAISSSLYPDSTSSVRT